MGVDGTALRTTALVALLLLGSCSRQVEMNDGPGRIPGARSTLERDRNPTLSPSERELFGKASREFAFELYRQLAHGDANVFVSPYSVRVALAMLYAGAAGETKSEMASALRWQLPESQLHAAFNAIDLELARRKGEPYPSSTEDAPSRGDFGLCLANGAFVAKGENLGLPFLDVLARQYGAGIFVADFATRPERERMAINAWVEDKTASRIRNLLPENSVGAQTKLVLVNAIYFKASWFKPFPKSETEEGVFHAVKGDIQVQMMLGETSPYARGDGYQATELGYAASSVRMLLVRPDEGRFTEIEAALDHDLFDQIRAGFKRRSVILDMPKFTFTSAQTLKPAMQALGMKKAFDGNSADFSGVASGSTRLFISDLYHKTFIAVDEEGTEAAAATAITATGVSAVQYVHFVLDRPFLFVIYDEPTGQILFVGRLMQPE